MRATDMLQIARGRRTQQQTLSTRPDRSYFLRSNGDCKAEGGASLGRSREQQQGGLSLPTDAKTGSKLTTILLILIIYWASIE